LKRSNCPACGSTLEWWPVSKILELSRTDYPNEVERLYQLCSMCGLIGKDDDITQEALETFYAGSYQFKTSRHPQCWDRAAAFIARSAGWDKGVVGKLVDVGSKGDQLSARLREYGYTFSEADALDASPTRPEVRKGWVGSGIKAEHGMSFVSATHILEHAIDPERFVRDILGMLKLTGVAYIEVPSVEGHAELAGSCDNINREHLWHFNQWSLFKLVERSGGMIVAAEIDRQKEGPVHRLMIAPNVRASWASDFRASLCRQSEEYEAAVRVIEGDSGPEVALYAASHSYAILRRMSKRVADVPVFDLYRFGAKFGDAEVMHPSALSGIKRLYVTTRFWNAFQDIKADLSKSHPEIEVLSPFGL
jgi:hypothetical protein